MTETPDATSLPWITLVTLACGYMGYYVANVGNREHHKQIDVAFSSLVFGLLAAGGYQLIMAWLHNELVATIYAVSVAVFAGAVWGTWGVRLLRIALRFFGVSFADDVPQAWRDLFGAKIQGATELSVETKSGTVYLSQGLHQFKSLPNGPCVLGGTGDILMYATAIRDTNGKWEDQDDLQTSGWGAVITYIPASEIVRIRFRRV